MSDPNEHLVARLTEAAREVTESLTADEITAIRRYQARDRTYELVSSVLRDPSVAENIVMDERRLVRSIVRVLTNVTRRWRVPEPAHVYRGQRSVDRVFGTTAPVGQVLEPETFLSTSVYRDVALDEFTVPPGRGGPALFEIDVAPGTPALWVPPVGDPALAYQGELLFPRRTPLLVRGERDEGGILVLDCEVLP